jgi:two-component system nitrogen regulation response regulator NtrX
VDYFIERISIATGLGRRVLAEDALASLQLADWPGNIRQLRNQIERLLILTSGDVNEVITADMLPQENLTSGVTDIGAERAIALPLREARELFERDYLNAQILRFGGNISRTAAFIGMERSALHRKLKTLGLGGNKPDDVEEH